MTRRDGTESRTFGRLETRNMDGFHEHTECVKDGPGRSKEKRNSVSEKSLKHAMSSIASVLAAKKADHSPSSRSSLSEHLSALRRSSKGGTAARVDRRSRKSSQNRSSWSLFRQQTGSRRSRFSRPSRPTERQSRESTGDMPLSTQRPEPKSPDSTPAPMQLPEQTKEADATPEPMQLPEQSASILKSASSRRRSAKWAKSLSKRHSCGSNDSDTPLSARLPHLSSPQPLPSSGPNESGSLHERNDSQRDSIRFKV